MHNSIFATWLGFLTAHFFNGHGQLYFATWLESSLVLRLPLLVFAWFFFAFLGYMPFIIKIKAFNLFLHARRERVVFEFFGYIPFLVKIKVFNVFFMLGEKVWSLSVNMY